MLFRSHTFVVFASLCTALSVRAEDVIMAGCFDIFPANADSGWILLRSRFTPDEVAQVSVHARPYATTQYHLIMPHKLKDSARYIKLFNQGLLRLKASGRYAEYMEQIKR